MEWIEEMINDKEQFPRLDHDDSNEDQDGSNWNEWTADSQRPSQVKFPKNFRSLASKMLRRMCRVYGHIYYAHSQALSELKLTQYVNTSFHHLLYFVLEHGLVKERDFYPMEKVVNSLYRRSDVRTKAHPLSATK